MNKYFRLAMVGIVCSYFWYYAKTYTEWHFIDSANLIFHEAGHTIFFFASEYWNIAAGSIFQVVLPLFIAIYFLFHLQKISSALALLWVGQNLLNVSVYAGDATTMQLNLLGGDSVIHDWNYLLGMTGNLQHAQQISSAIYNLGMIAIAVGTILALYFAWTSNLNNHTRQVV